MRLKDLKHVVEIAGGTVSECTAVSIDDSADTQFLVLLKGAPASGKTTLARGLGILDNVVRVNKDSIRDMLYKGVYSPHVEKMVVHKSSIGITTAAINAGLSVVIDDTNANKIKFDEWKALGESLDVATATVEMQTDLATCKKRNGNRPSPIPEKDLVNIYNKLNSNG